MKNLLTHICELRDVLERGGKQSATPLSRARPAFDNAGICRAFENAVAAALCRRNP